MHRKQRRAETTKEEQRSVRKESRSRKQLSEENEGGDGEEKLRWKVHLLEKDKVELTSSHNQELCKLHAELASLRSSVERGEAQREELQYQLTVSQRNEKQILKLTEQAAEFHQTVQKLQKALELTRQAREEDGHLLQQEIEKRDKLIQQITSENQQLQRLLQDHKDALVNSEQRIAESKKESEKEAREKRQLAKEIEALKERESKAVNERAVLDQRLKSLQVIIETEKASHLETKFHSEVLQLRLGDLQAALAVEKSGHQVALHNLELLRAQIREVEQVSSQEEEKSIEFEHHLQRMQKDFAQYRTELNVILEKEKKMTSDLTVRLEDEKRQHVKTRTLLDQNRSEAEKALGDIEEALQQHTAIETSPSAKDVGDQSSADLLQLLNMILDSFRRRLDAADQQVRDLLLASEKLDEKNQSLKVQNSEQSRQMKEAQQATALLQGQVDSLQEERSDWLAQRRQVQAELERTSEERASERGEHAAKVQELNEQLQLQSKDHLSFLYTVYQRLLTGCVLLDQHHGILGSFTWKELCDVINEQVDQLTADLRQANDQISHLQSVCNKKSLCVREMQRSQECVMSHLAESLRKREEALTSQHTHTVASLQKELQTCHLKCDALQERAASLQRSNSSLTSDLARLKCLQSKHQREVCSYTAACSLLAGALRHTLHRSRLLSEQKRLLSAQLEEKEAVEEELRNLAAALGDEEDGSGRRREMVVRRWRRSVCVVRAIRRWRSLSRQTSVLFQVEVGGAKPAIGVCGGVALSARLLKSSGEGRPSVCPRWLCSKSLNSKILSSMANLQEALSLSDSASLSSSSPDVTSAARYALGLLLGHFLDQTNVASPLQVCKPEKEVLTSSLSKFLVSSLQQHFLVFSQRLHSTEMERRSLRLEVISLRKEGRQKGREEMIPAERFNSVRSELRQSLSREREAQTLIQEQSKQLRTLQSRLNTHASEQRHLQGALSQATQSLSDLRLKAGQKERSLRILGKHLMGVQKERKQLRQRLQRADGELCDNARQRDVLIARIKAAETSYNQVRESLLQSHSSLAPQLHPSPLQHLERSLAECTVAGPEVAALQSLLSSVSQLCHSFGAKVDWLEQEVSTLRSHVMALRSELQDVCEGDSGAFVLISESSEKCPDLEASQCPSLLSNLRSEQHLILSPAPKTIPTSPIHKSPTALVLFSLPGDKAKEKRATKKSRDRRKKMD